MARRAGVGLSVCGFRTGPSAYWLANPGRRDARKPIEAPQGRKLGSFLTSMGLDNFVVHADTEDGFYRVDRRAGVDKGYVREPGLDDRGQKRRT